MNAKTFLAIAAAIALLYGIAFLVIPAFVMALYGIPRDAPTILGFRFFGTTLLSLGLVVWFVRATSDRAALRGLLLGLAAGNAVGALISISATVTGVMNAMGWSAVLIYVALVAGYLYFLFDDRTVAGRT